MSLARLGLCWYTKTHKFPTAKFTQFAPQIFVHMYDIQIHVYRKDNATMCVFHVFCWLSHTRQHILLPLHISQNRGRECFGKCAMPRFLFFFAISICMQKSMLSGTFGSEFTCWISSSCFIGIIEMLAQVASTQSVV